MTDTQEQFSPRQQKRKSLLLLLGGAVAVAVIGYGLYWGVHARYFIETDDAYVGGQLVQLTPQVGGTVVAINADDTDLVKAGQTVVEFDPADARLALERARAQLADAVRQARGTTFAVDQAQAQVDVRSAELKKAQGDLARREKLAGTDSVTAEELAHARDAVDAARAALDASQRQHAIARAQVLNSPLAEQPAVARAAAQLREALLAVRRSKVVAPIDGYVARRSVQVGQRVAVGTPMMAVVPLKEVWVDANFKEVQLDRLRIGQPVELKADLYGSSVKYDGKVVGMAAGTGSAFSLLPAQNATGNWIKVVQRVPVRVAIDARQLAEHPLRVGLSMTATVDTRSTDGKLLADAPRREPVAATAVYANDLAAADAEVADVIAANAGK